MGICKTTAAAAAGILTAALLTATVPPGLAAPTETQLSQVSRHYDFAMLALRAGNFRKAEKYLRKAVEILPNYPEAHIGLGQIAMNDGRFEDALSEFRTAAGGYVEMSESLMDLRVSRYVEAQQKLVKLRDEKRWYEGPGGRHLPASLLAQLLLNLEMQIRALEAMPAPARESGFEPPGEVFFYMGNALFRLGRLDEAVRAWETCVERDGKFPLVRNNLAVGYWMKGDLDRARTSLARAEALGLSVSPELKADLERGAQPPATAKGAGSKDKASAPPH